MPDLVFYTQKIADVHGVHHPKLIETAETFAQISNELEFHLDKEEEVLFPAIKDILRTKSPVAKATVVSEIERLQGEHEFAGGEMDRYPHLGWFCSN